MIFHFYLFSELHIISYDCQECWKNQINRFNRKNLDFSNPELQWLRRSERDLVCTWSVPPWAGGWGSGRGRGRESGSCRPPCAWDAGSRWDRGISEHSTCGPCGRCTAPGNNSTFHWLIFGTNRSGDTVAINFDYVMKFARCLREFYFYLMY